MNLPETISKFSKITFRTTTKTDSIGILVFSNDNIECETDVYITSDKKDGISFTELKDFVGRKKQNIKLFTHDENSHIVIVTFEYFHEKDIYEMRFFIDDEIFFKEIKSILDEIDKSVSEKFI